MDLSFIKRQLKTGDKITENYLDNIENGIKNNETGINETNKEIINARIDKDGFTHNNIKDRIDAIEKKQNDIILNIKNFGARGDSVTDDTEAFATALKMAYPNNSITLKVPKGNYIVNGYVDIYSNTKIIFDIGATIKKGSNSTSSYLFVCGRNEDEGTTGYGGGAKNVEIIGGTFIGNVDRKHGISMTFNHMENFKARGCTFINSIFNGHIFDLAGCKDIAIEECHFQGWIPQTDLEYTEAIQIDNSTSEGLSNNFSNYDNLPTCNVTVENCYFTPIYDDNGEVQYPAPNPIGSHNFIPKYKFKNIKFCNNYVEGNEFRGTAHSGGGIRFYAVDGVRIEGNTFVDIKNTNCQVISIQAKVVEGVIESSSNINIESNTFLNFKYAGTGGKALIRIYGYDSQYITNINICNNKFRDCRDETLEGSINAGKDLISTTLVNGIVVSNNIADYGRRLVYASNSKNITIENNIMKQLFFIPLSINESENIIVSNNIIEESNNGIYMSLNKNIQITSNIFKNIRDNLKSTYQAINMFKTCEGLIYAGNQIIKEDNYSSNFFKMINSYNNGKNQIFTNNLTIGYTDCKIIDVTSNYIQTIHIDTLTQTIFEN
jgi:hypothetical protein